MHFRLDCGYHSLNDSRRSLIVIWSRRERFRHWVEPPDIDTPGILGRKGDVDIEKLIACISGRLQGENGQIFFLLDLDFQFPSSVVKEWHYGTILAPGAHRWLEFGERL